jgi:hypothetical protein
MTRSPGKAAQHSISVDPARLLVILRLAGFMTADDVQRIAAEEQAAVRTLGVPSGTHSFLIDARALDAQTAGVVAFVQHTTDTVPLKPRRLAIVARFGLNRLQARRMIGDREIGLFDSEDEALAYLLR